MIKWFAVCVSTKAFGIKLSFCSLLKHQKDKENGKMRVREMNFRRKYFVWTWNHLVYVSRKKGSSKRWII